MPPPAGIHGRKPAPRHRVTSFPAPLSLPSMSPSTNASDLARFLHAQEPVYAAALAELHAGRKHTHWMWFIFPQLRGLGRSHTAHFYGLAGRNEAEAFLAHAVLGARLRECTCAILAHAGRLPARAILGSPDDLKLRSCLTLFASIQPAEPLWAQALAAFYQGQPDPLTLDLLASEAGGPGGTHTTAGSAG